MADAEAAVYFVIDKLDDVEVQEVLNLYGVNRQVQRVGRELRWWEAFLKDVGTKKILNEREKHWAKQVRDIAFSIEDVIDTFFIKIPQNSQKLGMRETIKNMLRKIKKLPAVILYLENEMKEIEIQALTVRASYTICSFGEGSGAIRLPVRSTVLPDIDPDIVGFKADQDHILKELLDETTKRRSVISICGTGGLGKTTLALKVYNCGDVKKQFEVRIWVNISQNFEEIDVLRKIAQQLNLEQTNEEVILTEIQKSLRDKKYLIVLDDVWTTNLWTQIGAAFPDKNNGSRVLMTTRFTYVSKSADPMCEPYKLPFLTEEFSRELLLKTVFPNHNPNRSSFDDLSEILDQFVHKCGGLPLALLDLGNLLLSNPPSYDAWSSLLRTMSWHVEGKICSKVISTSYDDLPFALQICFMYFAAFPQDYNIHATSLFRLWIAEGFIRQKNNRTLEETAECFLEELVQRSMVEVKSRSHDGSINVIRIHSVLRGFAIQKAKEDNFLLVYSRPDDEMSLSTARRVAIHNPDCEGLIMSQNLRTLLCFHRGKMPNCSAQRLLRVVSFGQYMENIIDLRMFEGLTHLRYLSLRGRPSNEHYREFFEKVVISKMKHLRTLQVQILKTNNDQYIEFPKCTWLSKSESELENQGKKPELPGQSCQKRPETYEMEKPRKKEGR